MTTPMSPESRPTVVTLASGLTNHNSNDDTPVPVPRIAAQSPLHELLIQEIAATVPTPVAEKLRATESIDVVTDWLVAGSLWKWLCEDSQIGRDAAAQFLEDLENNPRLAGLALTTTVARSLTPVLPFKSASMFDRMGAVLQCLAAGMWLAVRGTLLALMAVAASAAESLSDNIVSYATLGCFWPLALCRDATETSRLPVLIFGGFLLVILVELLFAPRLLRAVRRLPFRMQRPGPLLDWRVDSLLMLCVAQASISLAGLVYGEFQYAVSVWPLRTQEPLLVWTSWLLALSSSVVAPRAILMAWRAITRIPT